MLVVPLCLLGPMISAHWAHALRRPCFHLSQVHSKQEREREMFCLTTHSTHFIYGYMASDIWLRTILIVRNETHCRHIGYSYRLAARVLLYAPSYRQDNTYHGLCYTSRGALAGSISKQMRSLKYPGLGREDWCSFVQTPPVQALCTRGRFIY